MPQTAQSEVDKKMLSIINDPSQPDDVRMLLVTMLHMRFAV